MGDLGGVGCRAERRPCTRVHRRVHRHTDAEGRRAVYRHSGRAVRRCGLCGSGHRGWRRRNHRAARPEIAVVELGMNHAGEISTLARVAEPDVRVWTNVGEAHLGFFASLDAIADAKAEILERATPSTVLVANADDERVAARTRRFAGRTVTFGIDRDADIRATHVVDRGIEGIAARVSTPTGDVEIATPLIGRANLANLLAGTAVAL